METTNWAEKLTSRKFWVAVAAFLGSIATTIGGLTTDNEAVAITGIICGAASAAIYAACEAYTDGKRAEANTTVTEITETKTVSASSNSKETVDKLLAPPVEPEPIKAGGTDD